MQEHLDTNLKGPLPDDFPGRSALAEADINTYGQVRKAANAADGLTAISGIGEATAAKILDLLVVHEDEQKAEAEQVEAKPEPVTIASLLAERKQPVPTTMRKVRLEDGRTFPEEVWNKPIEELGIERDVALEVV